jgi:hypothetical protein
MEIEERIKKDLNLFVENCKKVKDKKIVDMAKRYYEDAKFYLERKDYFTAFGCINYAHGLIDALRFREE